MHSGGEKMQNREWRQVKENSLCTELTLDSTPPACMHLSPEPWGPVPGAAQTHGKEEEEAHMGDRGPFRAQPRPCPQEAVQGSLPHWNGGPHFPGFREFPHLRHLHEDSGSTVCCHSPQPRAPSACRPDVLVIFGRRLRTRCLPVPSANSLCKAALIYRKLQPRRLALK